MILDKEPIIDTITKKVIEEKSTPVESIDTAQQEYNKLEISDSLRFLALFDPNVRNQTPGPDGKPFTLHPWQVEVNEDISHGQSRVDGKVVSKFSPNSKHAYKYCLCAANGSGKDAFVIAPLALWFVTTKIQSKVIITSASGTQLTTQTEAYIKALARNVNAWTMARMGAEILKVNQRFIECKLTGGVIHLFATDEGEKAEGHHPTTPNSEMMIIVNEAKSVDLEIFNALRRCTGYNYWINVSSPGEPKGEFHKSYLNWPNHRRVSYFDCPHQNAEDFESDRNELGEYSFLFRSKWLALFTYIGGNYVVAKDQLDDIRALAKVGKIKPLLQTRPKRIGIDIALSGNGDESSISVWLGNVEVDKKEFRLQNAIELSREIELFLLKHVKKEHNYIFADDGGVGRAVIDILNERGWRIIRVLNNSAAKNKKQYRNRGAQLWYKFARLVEKRLIVLLDDDKSYQQLASRKYKTSDGSSTIDKLQLQSKREMISQGLNSPDRADAKILAFTDSNIKDFLDALEEAPKENTSNRLLPKQKSYDYATLKQLYRRHKQIEEPDKLKRIGLSQATFLQQQNKESQLEQYKFIRR